ncbi:hypothetical protein BT96DRAFT_475083 [Gymnopus androsaceus JB14]|uniref:Uncharacterized protein n=1 Tax=Gymnopus androsaceus JB14 TaxID=1447944 RepID=A0A6A4GQ57_9AGAR|nr:hypothetical protein BT96DRAFT_475083 [Gymnopus androsaceus JB14]
MSSLGGARSSSSAIHASSPAPIRPLASSPLRSRAPPLAASISTSHSGTGARANRTASGSTQRRPLGAVSVSPSSPSPVAHVQQNADLLSASVASYTSQASLSSYASFPPSESQHQTYNVPTTRSGSSPRARQAYFSPFASVSSSATSSPRITPQTQTQTTNTNAFTLRSDSDVFALHSHSSSDSDFSLSADEGVHENDDDDDDGVLSYTSSSLSMSLSGDDSDFERARQQNSARRDSEQSQSQSRYHDQRHPSTSELGRGSRQRRRQGQSPAQGFGRRSSESGSEFSLV